MKKLHSSHPQCLLPFFRCIYVLSTLVSYTILSAGLNQCSRFYYTTSVEGEYLSRVICERNRTHTVQKPTLSTFVSSRRAIAKSVIDSVLPHFNATSGLIDSEHG